MVVLAKKQDKILKKLKDVDITSKEMKILFYLFKTGKGIARDIEHETKLRQPEVSMAVRSLIKRGWLYKTLVYSPGKGRPQDNYHLAKNKNEIVKAIDGLFVEKIGSLNDDRQTFKELFGGIGK